MQIFFINNDGGGFASHVEVDDGTTVQELFDEKMPSANPSNYLIRVDRLPATAEQELVPGSRVSITPLKIEGA